MVMSRADTPRDVLFSLDALEAIGDVGRALTATLRGMALERTARRGGGVVGVEDVMTVVPDALAATAGALRGEAGLTRRGGWSDGE